MSRYFTLGELTRSAVAARHGIDNTPPPEIKVRLLSLAKNCLDPVRELWGAPLVVNSGFRCPVLNAHPEIGGAANSQHMRGEAADITTGSREGNRRLFEMVSGSDIVFDQLIDERGYSWIHISYRKTGNRRNILHL